MLVFIIKIIGLVIGAILVRSALPRYRIDQLLGLNWKFYIYIMLCLYTIVIILLLI